MKKYVLILLVCLFSYPHPVFADDSDLFTTQAKPNVLIILDNSNSMDEDFYGNAVGSFSPQSKTVVGKKALTDIISSLKDKLRVGLMTYNLSGVVSPYYLHNNFYFASYDLRSYCPNPPPECVKYAQTGDGTAKTTCSSACKEGNSSFDVDYFDEILNKYPIGSEQRTRYGNLVYPHSKLRNVNPTDPPHYIYYKHSYPLYARSSWGTAFGFSSEYNANEGEPWDYYEVYKTKTGTADDESGYSNHSFTIQIKPTDSDIALGYKDFGKRLYWYYVGKTWFAEGSPGNGYLHVAVDDLVGGDGHNTATLNNIYSKLDPKEKETDYMSCGAGDKNSCSYIINAGLTPTAGTFQEAFNYFKGDKSAIQAWCQKNFIIYVTDGLPSVDESAKADTADNLMPTVLTKIKALRNLIKNVKGKDGGNEDIPFDVKTYVLGVGLSDEAKLQLDKMAVPGGTDVSGHAYYADNPDQLKDALNQIFATVLESAYSFTSPTVPSVRMIDKDILYLSSFTPSNKNPFWPGSLKAYQLNADGTLPVDANGFPLSAPVWVASIPDSGTRVIKTYVGGALKDFNNANVAPADLAVPPEDRDALVRYIRNLPIGDIFHSNSVIVGSPSQFFEDEGFSGTGGFYETNKNRTKVIIVGANDGMLHAFDAATGVEKWAFIPNSVLKNLKLMKTTHTYFVDSTPKVADVWLDYNGDNKKSSDEWRTVLVCGLRKGGKAYFALDITDTLNPKYLWEFPNPSDPNYSTILAKLGQSWSEPAIGRVKIGGQERWVAFIGGGFGTTGDEGRVFYVVDIRTGIPIREFWKLGGMDKSLAAPCMAVDTNSDGFVEKAYIGDLKGQMWVFDVSDSDTTQWKGQVLFKASGDHPIYYQPAVAFDKTGSIWVYFGTGDREDPNNKNSQEMFYAVQVGGSGNYPMQETNLQNVTCPPEDPNCSQNTFTQVLTKNGWFVQLGRGEKVLARPAVFNRLVYFTTYTPGTTDLCAVAGTSKEYIVEYLSGGGALNVAEMSDILNPPKDFVYKRSQEIGSGAPSAPVITVNQKGKASVIIGTTSGQISSAEAFSLTTNREILFWREVVP